LCQVAVGCLLQVYVCHVTPVSNLKYVTPVSYDKMLKAGVIVNRLDLTDGAGL